METKLTKQQVLNLLIAQNNEVREDINKLLDKYQKGFDELAEMVKKC